MPGSFVEYAVPRNPALPSPALGDVIAGDPIHDDGGRPAFRRRVELFEVGCFPPARASWLGRGRLLALGRGFLFVSTARRAASREVIGEIRRLARQGTAEAGLEVSMAEATPAFGVVGRALSDAAVGCFLGAAVEDVVKARVEALGERLSSVSCLGLPYVDVVAVRCRWTWSWRRFRRIDWTSVVLEDARGATRSVLLAGPDQRLARVWLERRFDQEVTAIAREVWSDLLGIEEVWATFRARVPEDPAVALGRVWDEWQGEIRARVAALAVTPAAIAAPTVDRLGPFLDHYRRHPPIAPRVAALEALALGN